MLQSPAIQVSKSLQMPVEFIFGSNRYVLNTLDAWHLRYSNTGRRKQPDEPTF